MAQSVFQQFFENFQGLDLSSSDLTRSDQAAKEFRNCQFLNSKTIGKRPGNVAIGQPGRFRGVKTYHYRDFDTGVDQQDLLIFNGWAWRLRVEALSFTDNNVHLYWYWTEDITSDPDITWDSYNQLTGVSTGQTLKLPSFLAYSAGQESSYGSVYDVWAWATGLGYAWTKPQQCGVVNGNQTGTTINVDAGHTFTAGARVGLFDHSAAGGDGDLCPYIIRATTATTITLSESIQVLDNEPIGIWTASCLSINTNLDNRLDNVSFLYYWEPATFAFEQFSLAAPFIGARDADGSESIQFSFVNANDSLYVASGLGSNAATYIQASADYSTVPQYYGTLMKYDGQNLYRAGAPFCQISTLGVAGAGSSIAAGTYKYAIASYHRDNNEYETWGNIITDSLTSGSAFNGQITYYGDSRYFGFNQKYGLIVTGGTGHNFTVTATGGTIFEAGDIVCYANNSSTGAAALEWNRIASVQSYNLNVGSPTYQITLATSTTIANGTFISNGSYCKIYRTVDDGLIFYKVGEQVLPNTSSSVLGGTLPTFVDAIADPTANETLIEPDKGKTWEGGSSALGGSYHSSPVCQFVTQHQGAIVVGGDPSNANTIITSEPGDIEYFPLAFNTVELPVNSGGAATGLLSQTDDLLTVFKPNAVLSVAGDIATQAYTVRTVADGDYGMNSPLSTVRVGNSAVAVNNNGIFALSQESISNEFARQVNSLVRRKDLDFDGAHVFNDPTMQLIHFIVPITVSDITNMVWLVYDTQRQSWANYTMLGVGVIPRQFDIFDGSRSLGFVGANYLPKTQYWAGFDGTVGCAYATSIQKYIDIRPDKLPSNNVALCFTDDGKAIDQGYATNWFNAGQPATPKQVYRINYFMFKDESDNYYSDEDLNTYLITSQANVVSFFKDWDVSTLKGRKVINIERDSRYFQEAFKGYADKFRSMQVSFVNDNRFQSMILTGFEIVWKTAYTPEDAR